LLAILSTDSLVNWMWLQLTCNIAHRLAATTEDGWLHLLAVGVAGGIVNHAHTGRQVVRLLAARQVVIVNVASRMALRSGLLLRFAQGVRAMDYGDLGRSIVKGLLINM